MRIAMKLALALFVLGSLWGCKGNLKSNVECVPECSGIECGNDGCGGICGTCGPGLGCSDGTCVDSFCGNGRLDPGEKCDPAIAGGMGACVTECEDDGNSCTTAEFFGNPQDCDAQCRVTTIINCIDDDGCCPSGCSPANDSDCSVNCDNGVIDEGETCDPPSSCPVEADCDDGDACTTDSITGSASTCSAQCANIPLADDECVDDDGCCPSECGVEDDNDCEFVCGDGQVTGPENCDNAIPAGDEGACPADPAVDCDDGDPCTTDEIQGMADDCSAACVNVAITDQIDGDGCCVDPDNMTSEDDDDCPDPQAVCGNNIVEAGETCDSAIAAGMDGYCPANDADCDDGDACTINTMVGTVDDCTAECDTVDVMMPTPMDGCCYFAGLVMNEIDDCQTMCDDYCTAAITNCVGDDAIYTDDNMSGDAMDECQAACAAFDFPVGPPAGVDADMDTSGDTLTCRIYHLGLAAADPATHCPHAVAMSPVCDQPL